jgi:hypothetical protein
MYANSKVCALEVEHECDRRGSKVCLSHNFCLPQPHPDITSTFRHDASQVDFTSLHSTTTTSLHRSFWLQSLIQCSLYLSLFDIPTFAARFERSAKESQKILPRPVHRYSREERVKATRTQVSELTHYESSGSNLRITHSLLLLATGTACLALNPFDLIGPSYE